MSRTVIRILVLSLALAAPAARAQEAAQPKPVQVGVGVSLGGSSAAEFIALMSSGAVAPVMIQVPINFGNLRIEPTFGVYTYDEHNGGSLSVISVGAGAFYLVRPVKDFSYYVGPRLALSFLSTKSTGSPSASATDFRLDAAVGGEWWATGSFALGAEARLGYLSAGEMTRSGTVVRDSASGLQTGAVLTARFYF